MTQVYQPSDRIEWNPTGDEWLPGAVLDTRGESIRIWLYDGDVMWAGVNNIRAIVKQVTP